MSGTEFEKWMKKKGLTAVDIASALKMHPSTVTKFTKGAPSRRSTIAAFERFVASYLQQDEHTGQKHRAFGT